MKENLKMLLLKDLCARLPYKVQVEYDNGFYTLLGINANKNLCILGLDFDSVYATYKVKIENVKPYLFPLSNMTEEQKEEYCLLQEKIIYNGRVVVTDDIMKYLNWCYKNHLDINNLIPKGLAINCTNLNIY